MSKHLKNIVMERLKDTCATFVQLPSTRRMNGCRRRLAGSPHSKGVRYFTTVEGINCIRGAIDLPAEGAKRRKRIIVRPSRFRLGLHELYTYHFPKHWSNACVANRELIKEAQRQAHALEHDHSLEALEWRIRFFNHYFTVFKGGAKPEPGMKPYSRFYQYTYVAIYRRLQAERQAAQHTGINLNDISFEPIVPARIQLRRNRLCFPVENEFPKFFPNSKICNLKKIVVPLQPILNGATYEEKNLTAFQ